MLIFISIMIINQMFLSHLIIFNLILIKLLIYFQEFITIFNFINLFQDLFSVKILEIILLSIIKVFIFFNHF